MTTTSPTGTKHNHNDAFNRRAGCPRCEEIAAEQEFQRTVAIQDAVLEEADAATDTAGLDEAAAELLLAKRAMVAAERAAVPPLEPHPHRVSATPIDAELTMEERAALLAVDPDWQEPEDRPEAVPLSTMINIFLDTTAPNTHGAMKGNYTLSQAEWDEKLHGPAIAAPPAVKVMCWLCAGPHDVRDCPDKQKAINGGGIPRATLRSMGLVE